MIDAKADAYKARQAVSRIVDSAEAEGLALSIGALSLHFAPGISPAS